MFDFDYVKWMKFRIERSWGWLVCASILSFLFCSSFDCFKPKIIRIHNDTVYYCTMQKSNRVWLLVSKWWFAKLSKKKVEGKESEYSKHTKQHTLTVTEWENQIYTIIKFVFCCWFEQHKKEKKTSSSKDTHTYTSMWHTYGQMK